MIRAFLRAIGLALLTLGLAQAAYAQIRGPTLDAVKARGTLNCGVDEGLIGFGIQMGRGEWIGLDVDFCRAVASAIFDDPRKVTFFPLSTVDRFTALQAGKIDILARNTTWTSSRDARLGFNFAGVNYYDGQGFMVRREARISTALDLSGATVCIKKGTTSELNLVDYFRANQMQLNAVMVDNTRDMLKAYEDGKCVAMSTDVSALYAERLRILQAEKHVILPERISKEPLGPAVRHGDDQWYDVVRWTHFAMLTAEELDVTKLNVDAQLKASTRPEVMRLLGAEGKHGEALGLSNDWAYRIIKRVGNYGESFDRNLGSSSPLGMRRGPNALWMNGGLQYAPPIR